jgi:FkbM family methyltransferase
MLFSGPFIGKCFDLYGEYSESELDVMRTFVREGNVVIDVGANIGDLTVPLAQMVGPKGRVYAVESHTHQFNVLCANLALNEIRNTKPINAFVASSDQVDTASPVWGRHAFVSETWGAPFMSLDELDLPACRLIKVDVDGKELEVLKSGEMHIERFRPFLYVENDVREASSALIGFHAAKARVSPVLARGTDLPPRQFLRQSGQPLGADQHRVAHDAQRPAGGRRPDRRAQGGGGSRRLVAAGTRMSRRRAIGP